MTLAGSSARQTVVRAKFVMHAVSKRVAPRVRAIIQVVDEVLGFVVDVRIFVGQIPMGAKFSGE